MSERTHTFEVSGPPRIDVKTRSGDVIIRPSEGDTVTVLLSGNKDAVDGVTIDSTPGSLSVRSSPQRQSWFSKGVDVLISAPPGGSLRVGLGSGDVVVQLPMESIDVNTGSGDVRIEQSLNDLHVKVASGDVMIDGTVNDAKVTSASGDIRVGSVGNIVVTTAAGDANLGSVTGSARIKSASGDVKVREFSGSDLDIATMSGDSIIGLVPGMTVTAKISATSGEFRNRIKPSDVESTDRMTLTVKSFSGDVTVREPW